MKPILSQVDAALFDLDGTLVETNIDFSMMKREMIALALEHGLQRDLVEHLDILAIVDTACEAAKRSTSLEGALELRKRALSILEAIEVTHAQATQDIPFAREVVGSLKSRGVGVGIVTRNCRRASELSLEITGIRPDILISRDDTQKHKPHPEPLHRALEALSARPEASVMVGDHTMDIECGKRAGVKTIAFLRDHCPPDFFAQADPDFIAKNLEEVLHAIIDCHS